MKPNKYITVLERLEIDNAIKEELASGSLKLSLQALKHCACTCAICAAERANPGPYNTGYESGRILPGSTVVG